MDQMHRIGAYAAFVLTFQFLATLLWIAVSWPPTGLAGLMGAMADSFLAQALAPFPFVLMNLYNASFAASAIVLILVMRQQLPESPFLMQCAIIAIVIASALFLASGIIPIVSVPHLVAAKDTSAVNAIVGVTTGLVLGATFAAGAGVVLTSIAALHSGRLPRVLCYLFLIDGLMQLGEFSMPLFLILDPFLGSVWSLWLGAILWRDGLGVRRPAAAAFT
jgi:hypothetical protein